MYLHVCLSHGFNSTLPTPLNHRGGGGKISLLYAYYIRIILDVVQHHKLPKQPPTGVTSFTCICAQTQWSEVEETITERCSERTIDSHTWEYYRICCHLASTIRLKGFSPHPPIPSHIYIPVHDTLLHIPAFSYCALPVLLRTITHYFHMRGMESNALAHLTIIFCLIRQ